MYANGRKLTIILVLLNNVSLVNSLNNGKLSFQFCVDSSFAADTFERSVAITPVRPGVSGPGAGTVTVAPLSQPDKPQEAGKVTPALVSRFRNLTVMV